MISDLENLGFNCILQPLKSISVTGEINKPIDKDENMEGDSATTYI